MKYILILSLFLMACNTRAKKVGKLVVKTFDTTGYIPFKYDSTISDVHGNPKADSVRYLPKELQYDFIKVKYQIANPKSSDEIKYGIKDSIVFRPTTLWFCSDILYSMQEPLLYNFPLHKSIYRLTIIPGLIVGECIINIVNDNDSNFFVELKLYEHPIDKPQIEKPDLIKKTYISKSRFKEIAQLIDSSKFSEIPYQTNSRLAALDVPGFFLEVQNQYGYYGIFRWADQAETYFTQILEQCLVISDYERQHAILGTKLYKLR